MTSQEKLLGHFKAYLEAARSPVVSSDDKLLERILKLSEGARTLAQMETKT